MLHRTTAASLASVAGLSVAILTGSPAIASTPHSATVQVQRSAPAAAPKLVPLRQHDAYNPAHDCGPTSLAMSLLARGVTPSGYPSVYKATYNLRRSAMGKSDNGGTTLVQLQRGYAAYKIKSHIAGIEESIKWARKGHGVIVGGDAGYAGFKWAKDMSSGFHGGHYVYLAGYDAKRGYKVLDPVSAKSANVVHYVSAGALRGFSNYYPYSSNVIPTS